MKGDLYLNNLIVNENVSASKLITQDVDFVGKELNLNGGNIRNVGNPVLDNDVVTLNYLTKFLKEIKESFTIKKESKIHIESLNSIKITNKGDLNLNGNRITNVGEPELKSDVVTFGYLWEKFSNYIINAIDIKINSWFAGFDQPELYIYTISYETGKIIIHKLKLYYQN